MLKFTKMVAAVLLLPAVMVLSLTLDTYAAQKGRFAYRIPLSSLAGGPVRSGPVVGLPEVLTANSTPELNATQQGNLAWHFRNAAQLAERFAAREGVTLARQTAPSRVEIYRSPKEVAEATFMPETEYGCQVVARMNMRFGVVFLGRDKVEDLYVELGKWFLYPTNFHWGRDQKQDKAMLRVAERFAAFCMEQKNWVEGGGNMKSIW